MKNEVQRPHPIGLAPLTCLELSPLELVRTAQTNGYDFVGIRLIPGTEQEARHDMHVGSPMLREVCAVLRDTGLPVLDVEVFRLLPETDVAAFEPVLAAAQALGAREALVAGQDPDAGRLATHFARFSELAARYGVTANLEPMPWAAVRTLADAAHILARAGCANAGILLDTLHFDRVGGVPGDIAAADPQRFRYAQLCDAPAERPTDLETLLLQARCERRMPGDGALDLRPVVAALPPALPISLEIPMRDWARSADAQTRTRIMLDTTRRWLSASG
jgi:sugar phosphate isomerase/epimerase